MMYCPRCGKEIPADSAFCSGCGKPIANQGINQNQNNFNSSFNNQPMPVDEPNMMANIAGCCFPLVGIILYFVWKDTKPRSSSAICKWTIGGVVGGVVIYILFAILGIMGNLASGY